MNNGWIRVHRKTLDNSFCKNNLERFGFWSLLLLKANHADNEFFLGNQKVACLRGQFATSRKSLALEANVSEMKVERWLSVLKIEQQIEQQSFFTFRLITIKNYNKYQKDEQLNEQQMNSKRTANEQQTNTNKKDKNIKNDDKLTGFQKFWDSYPNRKARGAAEKAFSRVTAPVEVLVAAVEAQKKSEDWLKEDGKYIPHPATWLNQKRWEDEIKPVNQDLVYKLEMEQLGIPKFLSKYGEKLAMSYAKYSKI